MSKEDLEKIARLESRLKQHLIIPVRGVEPSPFASILLLLPDTSIPLEPTVGAAAFLSKKCSCSVKLVCMKQNCRDTFKSVRKELERRGVHDVEEHVPEDSLVNLIVELTRSGQPSLLVVPSPSETVEAAASMVKLVELLVQKVGFPILVIKKSEVTPQRLLSRVLVLVREPGEIKACLPTLITMCRPNAKITFLTYIDESFLKSVEMVSDALSELTTLEKEKVLSSACNIMEKSFKEVEPALVERGFKVAHFIEAGTIDVTAVAGMRKTHAELLVIPVKATLRPETKPIIEEIDASMLILPQPPVRRAEGAPPAPPKEKEQRGNGGQA